MPPTDPQLNSPPVLEELRSSRSLLDGVIPDTPPPQTDRTRFALGSCQYPGGFLDEAAAYAHYRDLAQRLDGGANPPRFVVLTGDQVYTDATAGLFDPSMKDGRYRLPYERWLRARAPRTALRQVESYMLLDDHEIENDWEGEDSGDVFDAAMRSYRKFQRYDFGNPKERYFRFEFDSFPFFMLDTRTRRTPRTLNEIETADLLDGQGEGNGTRAQTKTLSKWLDDTPADRPKFIVSPSMLLPRHRDVARWDDVAYALNSDGWDGYPKSLHEMLVMAQKHPSEHIVFLSGDEHVGCIATITVTNHSTNEQKTFHSIHSPGLYTPYAFANSGVTDWLPETNREFEVGGSKFDYTVTFTPYEGEGFAYVAVEKAGGQWHLTCQFAQGPVQTVF